MTTPAPLTAANLETLKKFWQDEDVRNGGVSDATRLIAEIERLRADNDYLTDAIEDAYQSLELEEPAIAKQQLYEIISQPPA